MEEQRQESKVHSYFSAVVGLYEKILTQKRVLEKCGRLLGDAIVDDRLIHVIGPGGHSNIGVEEVFWRAGGLVQIDAMLDPGTNLMNGAKRSNVVERTPGYAAAVFNSYRYMQAGDPLIIVNAYGINSMSIESALIAKERGFISIAVTSTSFCEKIPPGHPARHPSGKNLFEIADVFVNTFLPFGDAIVEFEGLAQKVASVSTLVNCFALNLITIETVRYLVEKGVDVPVWRSANLPGGDEANENYYRKFGHRIKHLI